MENARTAEERYRALLKEQAKLEKDYLRLLSEKFPTSQAAFTEIINLEAILNLPKGTEHLMSDIHGEYEAFDHILNTCSGVIRERVASIFKDSLSADEQAELCTLIYFTDEKLRRVNEAGQATPAWYSETLLMLVRLARHLSDYYTRSKVRKAMPVEYAYIIDELLHARPGEGDARHLYHASIIDSIIETGSAEDFIKSLCALIKRLAVDRLHVVGDLFDRGPHADRIIDQLMSYHRVDIQWGNHDICWMGAAAGSEACAVSVVRTAIRNNTLSILENGYGVSLRPLFSFAEAAYRSDDGIPPVEKAVSVILFKLEGQVIKRHPTWHMDWRMLLDHVDVEAGTVNIGGFSYELRTRDFPTLDPHDPYTLSAVEKRVVDELVEAFTTSPRLKAHVDFLYERGSVYRVSNNMLLFHGCVPLDEDGSFRSVVSGGRAYSGRAYFDFVDRIARRAWHTHDQHALDWMWYLWCGRVSPLSGRIVKTFEREYVVDKSTWPEPQDPYFTLTEDPAVCERILEEFGVDGARGHIVNGHTPVHASAGESPLKAGGKVIVIDGGFCEAYRSTTGIAGYTLISDAHGLRIKAHRPFGSIEDALDLNADIISDSDRFERAKEPILVKDCDNGQRIRKQITELKALLAAYRDGELAERTV